MDDNTETNLTLEAWVDDTEYLEIKEEKEDSSQCFEIIKMEEDEETLAEGQAEASQWEKQFVNYQKSDLSEKKWTHDRNLLLITCRLRQEEDFASKRKKASELWQKILEEIIDADSDFPFNCDHISRKFANFMSTYKRIKKRNNKSGEVLTTWEYFDMMDEVYGERFHNVAPVEDLDCANIDLKLSNDDNTTSRPQTPEPQPKIQIKSKNQSEYEIMQLLKNESAEDRRLVQELIDLEKKKLEVERDKVEVERQKVEEIKKLRLLLMSNIE